MADLDRIDRQILRALSDEARISNVELAERVGLSPSACLRRVQELERAGVIAGYHARLDPKSMGRSFVAYAMVGLTRQDRESHLAFEAAIAGSDAVTECHNVTGACEYLLRIEVDGLDAYKSFHTDILGALPQVASIVSHVVLATPKDRPL